MTLEPEWITSGSALAMAGMLYRHGVQLARLSAAIAAVASRLEAHIERDS